MSKFEDRHIAVVGLGFGDEGKGSIVDWLCATRPVRAVARFNGGGQAGHNVVLPDGRHHTFSQWGSGTLRGVPTFLSRYSIVDPLALITEAEALKALGVKDPFSMLYIDKRALIVTPYHKIVNQFKESLRGDRRHGSCGLGYGEAVQYGRDSYVGPTGSLQVWDLQDDHRLHPFIHLQQDWAYRTLTNEDILSLHGPSDITVEGLEDPKELFSLLQQMKKILQIVDSSWLDNAMDSGSVVFEGAQGVLLDEWYGFHPHTTWSTTTFDNADALAGHRDVYRLGVLRTTTTRHGAGPLPSEDDELQAQIVDPYNGTGKWQGDFRVGHFDSVLHQYAIEACGGVNGLALTHLDLPDTTEDMRVVLGYGSSGQIRVPLNRHQDLVHQEKLTQLLQTVSTAEHRIKPGSWTAMVQNLLNVPVVVSSYGPTSDDKYTESPDLKWNDLTR